MRYGAWWVERVRVVGRVVCIRNRVGSRSVICIRNRVGARSRGSRDRVVAHEKHVVIIRTIQ